MHAREYVNEAMLISHEFSADLRVRADYSRVVGLAWSHLFAHEHSAAECDVACEQYCMLAQSIINGTNMVSTQINTFICAKFSMRHLADCWL